MKKILLVEDDADILESLEITLRMKNYDVTTATKGPDVLPRVASEMPDLIIMDVMIPPPDGYALCKRLKDDDKTKNIPIILLSARTQRHEIDTGFQAGADRYLSKPFMNDELLRSVAALLKHG